MIRYDLVCTNDHLFDGWFSSSDGFQTQRDAGQIECPRCGSAAVDRQLMTPQLNAKNNTRKQEQPQVFSGPDDPRRAELVEAVRKLRRHLKENADDVGNRFAEEARRIHYGEADPRGIYGNAEPETARELRDEGIEVLPLPILPEDNN